MSDFDYRDNLISLARFSTPAEGAIALAQLNGAGIEAHLSDTAATWLNHVGPDLIGTELLVRQGDMRRAREVLGDAVGDTDPRRAMMDDNEDDADEDYWADDWSGEDWADDEEDEDAEWSEEAESPRTPPESRAFRAAVIGLFLLPWFPGILNLYSGWIIWRHRLWEQPGTWRYYTAIVINVVSIAAACWFAVMRLADRGW